MSDPTTHTCPTCGHSWQHGHNGSHECTALLKQCIKRLAAFAKDVRDNYDCDNDAHRHGTTCRACEAGHVLFVNHGQLDT